MAACGSGADMKSVQSVHPKNMNPLISAAVFSRTWMLLARSTHLGNTLSIDMGNSFDFTSRPFYGRVMETTLHCGATAAVRKTGIEGPRKHVAIVSAFWD